MLFLLAVTFSLVQPNTSRIRLINFMKVIPNEWRAVYRRKVKAEA